MCCLASAQKANVVSWIIIDSLIALGLLIGKVLGWWETRRNWKVHWAKATSEIACHELTLCILGSFFRNQSRIKGDDIAFKRQVEPVLPLQPVFACEKFLCLPVKSHLLYSFQPCMLLRYEFLNRHCHCVLLYPVWVTAAVRHGKARTCSVFMLANFHKRQWVMSKNHRIWLMR